MTHDKTHRDIQYGALPWRLGDGARSEVMLLTSRETRRWVIPKGWPMKKTKPRDAAQIEVFEEAGLVGQMIGKRPIGTYHYAKRLVDGITLCRVRVYLFRVERELDEWPEMEERRREWFEPREAARLVDEGGLAEIIGNFATRRFV
jgi:8-oxo-dGTP pyrophosphatase MutT (NUDIX family)